MTWLSDLGGMAESFDEEFGTQAQLVGMRNVPNRRADLDPTRPPFETVGVFNERYRPVGDGIRVPKEGLHETMIASTVCSLSVMTQCMPWLPTQGDRVTICEINRTFRILDIRHDTIHRTLLVLEALEPVPAR